MCAYIHSQNGSAMRNLLKNTLFDFVSPVPEAAPASGGDMQRDPGVPDLSFKKEHAVDIGGLAEAPLCPADHSETSLSDYITSNDRLQLRTEVLSRVVDAETFPEADESRPQVSKDIKHGQAALVFHPDAAEALKMAAKSVDGWEKEEEEEGRAAPTTRRQLERLHLVFRNTLLMCIAAFPQFPQFDLTKEDMDSFYDWFYGPTVAGRRPSPSDQTLLYAERNAWREMHELMHSGLTLKQAMTKVKEDSLFWMREVYERVIPLKEERKGQGSRRRANGGPPFASLTGRNQVERANPRTKARGKEPSPNPLIGLLTGLSRIQKGCPFAETIT